MQDFDLKKYISKNPLLEDTSTSEDFLDLLMEIAIESYCEENNILRVKQKIEQNLQLIKLKQSPQTQNKLLRIYQKFKNYIQLHLLKNL